MKEIGLASQENCAQSILEILERKVRWHAPLLIVLCGPSHVGKTTFSHKLDSRFTVISTDKIRERLGIRFKDPKEDKVWNIFESSKRRALREGRNVVLDACHMSERARWYALQGPNGQHRKICIVFDLPLRTVLERCIKGENLSLKEVERMWIDFEQNRPSVYELKVLGFDEFYVLKKSCN